MRSCSHCAHKHWRHAALLDCRQGGLPALPLLLYAASRPVDAAHGGMCTQNIFQKPESTASPPAYSQCRALPPAASKHYQVLPSTANGHRPPSTRSHRAPPLVCRLSFPPGPTLRRSGRQRRAAHHGARHAAGECGAGTVQRSNPDPGHLFPPTFPGAGTCRRPCLPGPPSRFGAPRPRPGRAPSSRH